MLEKYRKLSKNGTELAEDELNELKSKSQDMRVRMEHIDLQDIVEYSRTVRVKKDILVTDWFNVSLICLEEGQEIPPHPEPYAVLFHIIDGEGTITVGTKRHDALPGHALPGHMIFVPGNSIRGISPRTRMSLLGIQQPH
jgi:quercetin dioxygenase-like cupin family protein